MEHPSKHDDNDSDAEYERMAADYQKTHGLKLPPRNKGSVLKSGNLGGRGFPRSNMMAESEATGQSQTLIAQSAAQPQIT